MIFNKTEIPVHKVTLSYIFVHRSSHRLLEEIKRVHAIQERAASLKQEQTAQAKIKTLVENPEHAAQRLARNAAT